MFFDQRSDELNLIDSLIARGYKVSQDLPQIVSDEKIAVFISDDHPLKYSEGRGDALPNSVEYALSRLKNNKDGFFVMIEGAQIDLACEDNDQAYLLDEMLDFDRAVGKALDFAERDDNTLVVITGDHETGGYALLDGSVENNTVEGQFMTIQHTGSLIPVFAFGPGAEDFSGTYENTEFFYKFLEYFGLDRDGY